MRWASSLPSFSGKCCFTNHSVRILVTFEDISSFSLYTSSSSLLIVSLWLGSALFCRSQCCSRSMKSQTGVTSRKSQCDYTGMDYVIGSWTIAIKRLFISGFLLTMFKTPPSSPTVNYHSHVLGLVFRQMRLSTRPTPAIPAITTASTCSTSARKHHWWRVPERCFWKGSSSKIINAVFLRFKVKTAG